MGKVRESNFELLRCVLMFMVIILHYNLDSMGNAFSYVVHGTINYYFIYFIESMSIIATNVFVILAGYFGWKSMDKMTLRKPLGLAIYVVAYNVLFCILNTVILGHPISLGTILFNMIPKNWYITLYVTLLIFSPFINWVISKISSKAMNKLILLMIALFSVYPTILDILSEKYMVLTSGMYPVSMTTSLYGYSIVNFVMLYLIGAALSKQNLFMHHVKWDVLAYAVLTCIVFVQKIKLGAAWSYANPILIMSCIAFFNIFRKMHFTSKVVNTLAKSALGVFLLHTQYMVCGYGWTFWNIPGACQGSLIGLMMNLFGCCLVTYFGCTFFDMICRFITRPVSKLLDRIPFLNKQIIKFEDC